MNAEALLLVDKPPGWTSHDVVAFVRARLGARPKVGHSGTLDPAARGLLVLLLGAATRRAGEFLALPKTYSGRLRLGFETDTGDAEGKPSSEPVPFCPSEDSLRRVFLEHVGEVSLPIPAYSAVKHQGLPLYAYARRGVSVPEKTRVSRVDSWELTGLSGAEASFRLRCSSGTYVRALAVSVGRKLGCGAHLCALTREEIGPFKLSDAVGVERLRQEGCAPFLREAPASLFSSPA